MKIEFTNITTLMFQKFVKENMLLQYIIIILFFNQK